MADLGLLGIDIPEAFGGSDLDKITFVLRSKEHGNKQVSDLKPSQDWDYIVNDLHELADKLGCSKEGSF